MAEDINNTIGKMVKILKTSYKGTETNNIEFSTPIKRSLSSASTESSLEEPTPPHKKSKLFGTPDILSVGSPREFRRLRADLVEARNIIINLEKRISDLHIVRKKMELVFDNETQVLKRQHEYDRKTIQELESNLDAMKLNGLELKKDLEKINNTYEIYKLNTDMKIEELEKNLTNFKEDKSYTKGEENIEISNLKRKICELESVIKSAEDNAEAQKKIAEDLQIRLREKNGIERNLDLKDQALQMANLQIKELKYAKENFLEYQEQARTQVEKLNHYFEMEKENKQLKDENIRLKDAVRNKLVLEEEVYDLKNRLTKYKELEKKYNEMQMQQTHMEMSLSEWRAVARGVCESTDVDSSLPHLLRAAVERLQQQEINLTSEKVELESKLKTAVHEAKVAKSELEKSNHLVKGLKNIDSQRENLVHRIQKKLQLVSRERDSYRMQLDSYEKDLTMNMNTTSVGGSTMSTQKERVDNLERIIEDYRDMVARLENDLQAAQPSLHNGDPVPAKADQLKRLQDEVDQLKYENKQLRDKKDELEIQIESYAVGHDTLQGGQVFHLANNPLSQCLAQREYFVENLEKENDKLKKKIKNLEEGLETSKLADTSAMTTQEVKALQEQIKSQEIQIQRLKEFFKSTMSEFRSVIYLLLGYKIDRSAASMYTLRSIYAEDGDDKLCFQYVSDGDLLNLLETNFSNSIEDMINLHLRQNKSIPVFLSAITIDLFNNRTKTIQIG